MPIERNTWEHVKNTHTGRPLTGVPNMMSISARSALDAKIQKSTANTDPPVPSIL